MSQIPEYTLNTLDDGACVKLILVVQLPGKHLCSVEFDGSARLANSLCSASSTYVTAAEGVLSLQEWIPLLDLVCTPRTGASICTFQAATSW